MESIESNVNIIIYLKSVFRFYTDQMEGADHKVQGPVLLTLLRHVARILANGRAAFFESCDAIGWNSCDVSQKR